MLTSTVACMLEPLWIRIPYITQKGAQGSETQWQSLPIIMPNVLVEHIWKHFPGYFAHLIGSDLERFWKSIRPGDPKLHGHPMLGVDNWMRRFIPLAVHGDGVRFNQKGNNLLVLSMSFLLCSSWSWASIFMMACFAKVNRCYQRLHGADTWKIIWGYVCPGFRALMTGEQPPLDPSGGR